MALASAAKEKTEAPGNPRDVRCRIQRKSIHQPPAHEERKRQLGQGARGL